MHILGKQVMVLSPVIIHAIVLYLTDNAKPGDKFSIAILGINGPLGKIPNNYIWIRNAVVDFYKDGLPVNPSWKNIGKIYTIDDELNHILPQGTMVDKVADGF